MLRVEAVWTPLVKDRPWRAARASHSIESTLVSSGKLRVDRMVSWLSEKAPVMVWRVVDRISVIWVTLDATRSPLISVSPDRSMLSVVPVAMAMEPVKVLQPAAMAVPPAASEMVVVEAVPMEQLLCATTPAARASAGTRYLADIVKGEINCLAKKSADVNKQRENAVGDGMEVLQILQSCNE